MVPEPKHTEAGARELLRPLEIFQQAVCVLTTVKLDDQASPDADEIHDVAAERRLATEPVAAKLTIADAIPEAPFGVDRIRAQSACVRDG